VRYGQDECEHGVPGGDADTCPLCRVEPEPDPGDVVVDVRKLAAGDDP
jgi:hypothetical protein